jgi:DnaJ-class molecular chaperone
MRNYYDILGVARGAPAEEIKRAYRRLARRFHPDMAGCRGADSFRQVQEAYETLSDECRRRAYDDRLLEARRPPAPVHSPAEWFSDEVAIDFPSVAAIVDRIRRNFLGADDVGRPIRAEILVSPREAKEGVDIPLDVPIRGTCRFCGGRGETWTERCGMCGGSGEARLSHRVRFSIPPGVADGTRFRFSLAPHLAPRTLVEVRIAIR